MVGEVSRFSYDALDEWSCHGEEVPSEPSLSLTWILSPVVRIGLYVFETT